MILRLDMNQLDSNYSGSDYLAPDKEKAIIREMFEDDIILPSTEW